MTSPDSPPPGSAPLIRRRPVLAGVLLITVGVVAVAIHVLIDDGDSFGADRRILYLGITGIVFGAVVVGVGLARRGDRT